ncbi:hypothetical protein QK291_12990 [Arthrobacter sp. AL12]|nr:hypothetical protein [Arthrobacter sp. AL12]
MTASGGSSSVRAGVRVLRALSGGQGLMRDFEALSFVHALVSLNDAVHVGGDAETLPSSKVPLKDVGHELFDVGSDPGGTTGKGDVAADEAVEADGLQNHVGEPWPPVRARTWRPATGEGECNGGNQVKAAMIV